MTKKYYAAAVTMAASALLGSPALALDPQGYKTANGVLFTPTLQVSERWDDNIRGVEKNEESSFVATVTPSLNIGAKGDKTEFNVDLSLSHDAFHSSHDDDNTDRFITAMMGMKFDARNRLRLDAGYNRVEETAPQVQTIENDVSATTNFGALYGFGAETARAQAELGASINMLRFKNRFVLPSGATLNDERERDGTTVKGILYMGLAPKTKALLEVRHTTYEYETNTALDSTNLALLAGVKWDATAMTSGSLKLGTETKEFDTTNLEKDKTMWEASVTWAPLTYSSFTLTTSSQFDEGNNGASLIESQTTGLSWDHQWLKRLKSTVTVSSATQEFLGAPVPSGANREDELTNAGFGFTYSMRRWLDVGLGYKFSETDSNAPTRSFERNMTALTVTASL